MEKRDDQDPVTRITRWTTSISLPKVTGPKLNQDNQQYVVFGEDAQGTERVYAHFGTRAEFETWAGIDPLWKEGKSSMFRHLLKNPGTRDLVIRINLKAALDRGDMETAMELCRHLSPEARAELTRQSQNEPS